MADRVIIIGAGIAGLATAHLLTERGAEVAVLEASDRVGGLSRSFEWHGFSCDIAPHRLYTDDEEALGQLLDLVPMERHERRSRILIADRMMRDPINPLELVLRLPPSKSAPLIWGFLFRPRLQEDSFESLALNRYGRGLYDFFFEPYTHKMFGVSPAEISVSWGRQKLRSSGLREVLRRDSKTFFRRFYYPRRGGYGAICDALHRRVENRVRLGHRVTGVETEDQRVVAVHCTQDGTELRVPCDRLVSTLPATLMARMLGYELPLRFQSIHLVYLLVDRPRVMPWHWVYFGDREVVINRFAEFKNFSPHGVPEDRTVVVAEVTAPTEDPLAEVLDAVERYGLVSRDEVLDTHLIHERFAYPVYDLQYDQTLRRADELFGRHPNLHQVGRNAEFRHIEVDESYASALALVRRLDGRRADGPARRSASEIAERR